MELAKGEVKAEAQAVGRRDESSAKSGYKLTSDELIQIKKARAEVQAAKKAKEAKEKAEKEEKKKAEASLLTRRLSHSPNQQLKATQEHVSCNGWHVELVPPLARFAPCSSTCLPRSLFVHSR